MNPFLRYLADKNSAHTHTDRHTPLTTRPDGLRRAGNYRKTPDTVK